MSPPLPEHEFTVPPEWIDYNGHLRDGYYLLVFSEATEALLDALDLGEAYRRRTGSSLYTVEAHVSFLRQVEPGAWLRVRTRLLGNDDKRLHLHHSLYAGAAQAPAATAEFLLLHVQTDGPRASALPAAGVERIARLERAAVAEPAPPTAGCIALGRRGREPRRPSGPQSP